MLGGSYTISSTVTSSTWQVRALVPQALKPISRLEMIAVMGYSPASTKEELVHQSMNLLQCLWEAQSRYRCEVRALTQSAMQDMGLKRHFPGKTGAYVVRAG